MIAQNGGSDNRRAASFRLMEDGNPIAYVDTKIPKPCQSRMCPVLCCPMAVMPYTA